MKARVGVDKNSGLIHSVSTRVERAKAHIRAKVEHPFRVMEQQFGFQKTRLPGMAKNHCKVMVLADLTNGAYVPQCRTRLKAVSATV